MKSPKISDSSVQILGIFLLLILAGIFFIQGGQNTLTGTVVSLSPVDYTNNIVGQSGVAFTKAFLASVELGRGGQYLQGVQSNTVKGTSSDGQTKSQDSFNVKFTLNELACRYPVALQENKIGYLSVQPLQPATNQIFTTGWSYACSLDAQNRLANIISGNAFSVYIQKQIGTDQLSGVPVYCNAVSTSCLGDFQVKCPSSAGYRMISCNLPQSQVDQAWNAITGGSRTGYACVKVTDYEDGIDWSVFSVNPQNPYASATLTVTDSSKSETAPAINLGNGGAPGVVSGGNSKVYASMETVQTSFSQQCPSEAGMLLLRQNSNVPNYRVIDKASYTTQRASYDRLKGSNYLSSGSLVENVLSDMVGYNSPLAINLRDMNQNLVYSATNGQILYDMKNNPPFFPIVNLWINADWVGIVVPLAVPSIGQIQSISTASGVAGQGAVTITNTAPNAGSITVDLPTCTPSTPTFSWINNPNRAYNTYEPYGASFSVTGNEGVYSCTMKARSGGPSQTGTFNEITSNVFTVSISKLCEQPPPPRILSPTTSNPCRIICPLDPEFNNGQDLCAQSGLVYDSVQCKCAAKPNCEVTNTCPVCTTCSDGTGVNICVPNQQTRCKITNNQCTLTADPSCVVPRQNKTQCLPLIQYPAIITTGGVVVPLLGNIGGEQEVICQTDYVVLGVIVLIVVAGMYFIANAGKKRR